MSVAHFGEVYQSEKLENIDLGSDNHPFYQRVYLPLMPIEGGQPKVIRYLYGGLGTMNVPSWSPDSKKIAFVSNGTFN